MVDNLVFKYLKVKIYYKFKHNLMMTGISKHFDNHRIDFINSPKIRSSIYIKCVLKLLKTIIDSSINVNF